MAKEFTYKKLKSLDGYWRVDGIGKVKNRGSYGVSCEVHFQSIPSQYAEGPEDVAYSNQAGTNFQFSMTVHVATLSQFKVGTIWKHGKLYRESPKIDTWFEVDVRRCRYVRLGEETELGDHTVPTILSERYFKLGPDRNRKALQDAYYAVAPVVNNKRTKWVVVPASELLRFYYAPSSPMLTSIVKGKIGDYISLKPNESYLEGTRVFLRNRQRLTKLEAYILGRLIASPVAMAEARHIHEYLATRTANRANHSDSNSTDLTLHVRFPFRDWTQLAVRGKRIKVIEAGDASEDQWGIFAMEILHCSHSLGFERLVQVRDEKMPAPPGSGDSRRGPPSSLRPTFDENEKLETVDTPPNGRFARLAEHTVVRPFSDMPNITFEYMRVGEGKMGTIPAPEEEAEAKALSMSEGTNAQSSKNVLGSDMFQSLLEKTSRDLSIFLKMLTYLRRLDETKGWAIATKPLSESTVVDGEHLVSFPLYVGRKRRWHIIQDDERTRLRYIVLVEITLPDGRKCYLLEMELRPDERSGQCTLFLHTAQFHEIDEAEFISLFRLSAMQRRWIRLDSPWGENQAAEQQQAERFFKMHQAHRFGHLHAQSESTEKEAVDADGIEGVEEAKGVEHPVDAGDAKQADIAERWAKYLAEKMIQKVFPFGLP